MAKNTGRAPTTDDLGKAIASHLDSGDAAMTWPVDVLDSSDASNITVQVGARVYRVSIVSIG